MEEAVSFVGLMNDFVEGCTLIEKTRVPDGEGGWTVYAAQTFVPWRRLCGRSRSQRA